MDTNTATIYEVLDEQGECIGYGVLLKGHCADVFGMDTDESFENEVDAHAFAERCSIEAGARIVWDCIQPCCA